MNLAMKSARQVESCAVARMRATCFDGVHVVGSLAFEQCAFQWNCTGAASSQQHAEARNGQVVITLSTEVMKFDVVWKKRKP